MKTTKEKLYAHSAMESGDHFKNGASLKSLTSKKIEDINDCIDNHLDETKSQSIGAPEANKILAEAGILSDRDSRSGLPLRRLLRENKLPHAYQLDGKDSTWFIPHSKKAEVAQELDSPCVKTLMNEQNFKKAAIIDEIVPNSPGIYCIRIANIEELPEPFKTDLADRKHNIIYIGVASGSLNRRFLNQELRANGHGTFFRSIGAVLGYRPLPGSLSNMKNKKNYKFSQPDEQKIINWINQNLVVNWIEWNENINVLEKKLIQEYRPLLNIEQNPSKLQYLSDLRKECVRIANEK